MPYLGRRVSVPWPTDQWEGGQARALCTRQLGIDLLGDIDVVLCTFNFEDAVRLSLVFPEGYVAVGHFYSL